MKIKLSFLFVVFAVLWSLKYAARPVEAVTLDLSARANVGMQENVLVTEFVVQGNVPIDVLVRASGPSLTNSPGSLADPFLELRNQGGALLEFNDDWQQSARSNDIQSSGLAPSDAKESAILRSLPPGMYSVVVRGVKNSSGIPGSGRATVEVYDFGTGGQVMPATGARAYVGTGDDVLIAGFTISGSSTRDIVGRMLGASLSAVPNSLLDPAFELRNANGALLIFNDNWKSDANQQTLIKNSGLAPSDDHEAAFAVTLAPGSYTAIGRGVNNTTGIGFAQFYTLPYSGATLNPAPVVGPSAEPTPNQAPVVQLTTSGNGGTTPADGSRIGSAQAFTLSATATDDKAVASVAFLIDGAVVARLTEAPYTFATSLSVPGDHILMARATDSQGATTDSNRINIIIMPSNGVEYSYVGSTGGKWSDASNWSPKGVPGANDLAQIKAGQTVSLDGANIVVGSLSITGDSAVTGPGTLAIGDSLWFKSGRLSSLQLQITNLAQMVIPGDGRTEFASATVTNDGAMKWLRGTAGIIVADASTEVHNTGSFTMAAELSAAPGAVEIGRVTNSGTVKVSGGVFWGRYEQASGQLDLGDDARCASCTQAQKLQATLIKVTDRVQLNGGVMTGSGTIDGLLENIGASIVPGHSPGYIQIHGDYSQGSKGSLALEVAGTGAGDFDQLTVTGKATLGGTMSLRAINGFTPDPAVKFTPIQFGSVTGSFASTTSNIAATITSSGVDVKVTGPNPPPPQAQNLSTRLSVQTGQNVLIGGFIITGPSGSTKTIAVRGLGPSLSVNGTPVAGRLPDPFLELHNASGALIAANDNWKDASNANEIPSILQPSSDREAVLMSKLPPGLYTAILKEAGGQTGIGLAEIFDLDQPSATELANISTRGLVQAGDDVLIGGFIVGGTEPAKVLIRGIGPSLAASGVANALADPTLELHDANGAVIRNDDWRNAQETEIMATGVPPTDGREPAILSTLSPGLYTAIVRGKGAATGVALVEIYMLQ